MRQSILDECSVLLLKKGFIVKNLTRSCFDILARREDQILLIKILEDANSISKEFSEDMATIASYMCASPIIIAEKAREFLLDNVVYSRFSISTLNMHTFKSCIENKHPFIKRNKAGLTAQVVGKKLKDIREAEGHSLNYLAKKIGVSSRMISKYESGNAEITLQKALKMHDLFGDRVFEKIDVFNSPVCCNTEKKSPITRKYSDLGFRADDTKKGPFDIIAKKDDALILTEVGDKGSKQIKPLAQLLEAEKLVIFKNKKPKDIPSLTKEEFLELEKAKELLKFLKEF